MPSCEIKINKTGTQFKIQIIGTIDEDTNFSAYPLTGATQLEINLGGVKSINSTGIREWVNWIGAAGGAAIVYTNCPKIIIDQINMVRGFLPKGGKVLSFYVPYYSEELKSEKHVLFTFGQEYDQTGLKTVPSVKDDKGNPMEMDVIESKYFKFLK